ncbi:type II toxin-antitoxin system VapC family toxin [Phytoactinopolyspora halotolerans]|uniref:Ribonuclease VapC n=1 Tax=Phytoactinopolyspora halotolerans TaxID=1981512 RepID=A0A6L9S2X9_9ACTN|nr:type II toxin-antitoxin system VapC family toxin [Phytoactinopolyspora halotolerans]NED99406.1 type II toxin-antitoxin system VapC family toxin [Phytoactinopolyspora halotolerans]
MSYLLDTNVVSEWLKPQPDPGLVSWTHTVDEDRTYLSVVTIGELREGMERMPPGRRRERHTEWLDDDLLVRFEGRVLPVDVEVADAWGRMMARTKKVGRCVEVVDALIAATAEAHRLEVVTRNVAHFSATGVKICNPWSG